MSLHIPLGGRVKHFSHNWGKITKDPFILNAIQGCKINFSSPPLQLRLPHQIKFNDLELNALLAMIAELEEQNVIQKCDFKEGDFLNNVFLREKKRVGGELKYRMILNMKTLNKEHVELIHHKIEGLTSCLNLMEPNCFMASIDISNAFHTIPIHPDYIKYLKFQIGSQTYQYLCLPMGFRDSPRLFAKILKPVLAHLRSLRLLSSLYIDDFFLLGPACGECSYNVKVSLQLLKDLGFDISDKSILQPTQKLLHLGFILDSISMTVSLGQDKLNHIQSLAENLLDSTYITVRVLAQFIGTLVAAFPGVEYGQLFYRHLEFIKIDSLASWFNYDQRVFLSQDSLEEILWWKDLGEENGKLISHGNPAYTLRSDASGYGWGAHWLHDPSIKTQGLWGDSEIGWHINPKELKAVLLGLQSLAYSFQGIHICVETDSSTTLNYINNMGGTRSRLCNKLSKQLWLWCRSMDIWLTASFIPGVENTADALSRKFNYNLEWSLDREVFSRLCIQFGKPEIDAFASRINNKLPAYFSFNPDPQALAIDAFNLKWDKYMYIFPPFNLIPRILRKIQEDHTPKVLLIAPLWKAAVWYPKILKMVIKPIKILEHKNDLLTLPGKPGISHPLFPKMRLMALVLSGKNMNDRV